MLASFLSVMGDGVVCTWHRGDALSREIRLALKPGEKLVWGSVGKRPRHSM